MLLEFPIWPRFYGFTFTGFWIILILYPFWLSKVNTIDVYKRQIYIVCMCAHTHMLHVFVVKQCICLGFAKYIQDLSRNYPITLNISITHHVTFTKLHSLSQETIWLLSEHMNSQACDILLFQPLSKFVVYVTVPFTVLSE